MRISARLAGPLAFLVALVGLLAAIAVISAMAGEAPLPSPAAEAAVDLIAYADPSGRIHVVDPEGLQDTTITDASGFYTWPAWSPDASSLAFSGFSLSSEPPPVLELHKYDLDTGTSTLVYVNAPGMGPILDGMPHYPLWSPDSTMLGIMAGEYQGLTLLLADPGSAGPHDAVIRNSPLYAGWSSDSSRLLAHAGAENYVLNVHGGTAAEPIGTGPTTYRAPAWRHGSDQVAVVSLDERGEQILTVLDVVSDDSLVVQPVTTTVAFSWSPDGEWLAVGETSSTRSITYQGVRLISWDGSRSVDAVTSSVVAFFWSPNSRYMAYVTTPDASGAFEWRVHDIRSRTNWHVAEFVPSAEQATMFRFFDQFSQSHSVWSPQSDALVFAGALETEGVSASLRSQTPTSVLVADAMGRSPVQIIGTGILAVWSPR